MADVDLDPQKAAYYRAQRLQLEEFIRQAPEIIAAERCRRIEAALRKLRDDHGHEMDEHGNPWHPSWCVACVADAALAPVPAEEGEDA